MSAADQADEAIGIQPAIEPDPSPEPITPTPIVAPSEPAPETESDFDRLDREHVEQQAGARKALLASSLNGAVETNPEHQSKVVALADKLGLRADVVEKNYEALTQRVQLQSLDYTRLLTHHPEVANWLTVPENAKVAHHDVPVLSQIDHALKILAGEKDPTDATGVLPPGYMFKTDGTIRGPLSLDGHLAPIYASLDDLRQQFERQRVKATIQGDQYDAEHADEWFPNIGAGARQSVAATLAALGAVGGSDRSNRRAVLMSSEQQLGEAAARDPSLMGAGGRLVGQLLGDAPLYLLGGEVAGVADLAASLKTVAALSRTAQVTAPTSEYLMDVFKTAAAYSPIAARSGINTGSDHGPGYGVADFLINALGPASFGSRFGLANALVPRGTETAAAAAGWSGVAGRLLAHSGSQGGVMAATELANALHEVATGVDPDALKAENILPRLAQAGAMGAVLSGAFHLPSEVRGQVIRQQIAAHAAITKADQMGQVVDLLQAAKVNELSPERVAALLKDVIPDSQRITYAQSEDWDGIAKDAGMTPEDLAAEMHMEEQYREALATGKTMQVPTGEFLQKLAARAAAGGENAEKVVAAALKSMRDHPEGMNANEAVQFYKEKPEEIAQKIQAMKEDMGAAAKAMPDSDPIYQDFLGKALGAGRPEDEAKQDAKLMAAFFNTRAERWNANPDAKNRIDPLHEYAKYQIRIMTEQPGALGDERLDTMLDQLRAGKVPKEAVGPVGKIARDGITPMAIEEAHAAGHITDLTPEALSAALEAEQAQTKPNALREALLALQQHLTSKGIDIGKTNAEIRAALIGESAPVKSFEQRLNAPGESLAFDSMLKQWKKAHGDRTPTPGSKEWEELEALAKEVDAQQGKSFNQPGDKGKPQATISIDAERHFLITLKGNADLSSVLHESGHAYLEIMGDFAEREGAPAEFTKDYADILEYLGAKDRAGITEEMHEKWARSIEQYLMEGQAPSPELRPAFQRFALWLSDLYKKFKSLVTLTPEVKRVMDRLFATDAAIAEANKELNASTIFKDGKPPGMTDEGWARYLKANQRKREQVNARVFNKAMRTLRSEKTKTYRREMAGATEEAAKIVNERPVHIAEDIFVRGLDAEGKDLPERIKLDRREIAQTYGEAMVKALPRGSTEQGGMPLQMAADLVRDRDPHGIGFRDGKDLIDALAAIPDRKEEVKKLADGIMAARHPDLTPEAMRTAAIEAVHANSGHADVLALESAYLAIKAGQTKIAQEQIRDIARELIAKENHRDVNPDLYLRAEKKASQDATDAFLRAEPDYTAALLAKQREELAHASYEAAAEAKTITGKADELMHDARRTKTRAMLGKAGAQAWLVTDAEGLKFPFLDEQAAKAFSADRPGSTATQGPAFLDAMDQMAEFWRDKAERYKMTAGQVSDFYDMARQIMHHARSANTLLVDGQRVALEKEVATAIRIQNENHAPVEVPRTPNRYEKLKANAWSFEALHRSLSAVARQMDGEKTGGWHWEHFVRPLNKGADEELKMHADNLSAISDLEKEWGKAGQRDQKVFVPGVMKSLSLEGRIMVGMNTGALENIQRLMNEGWTREQIKNVTDTLDKKDWAFIHGVRQQIKTHKEAIWALKRRLDGIPPKEVQGVPWETAHGTIQGDYFPIVYDPHLTARALEISLQKDRQSLFGQVGSGFTEQRAEVTNMRLLLDFRAITNHLSGVEHYLTHAEPISDINKLLSNQMLAQNIIDRYGQDALNVIRETVQDVARGVQGPQNVAEKIVRYMRQRSGMAVMAFNAMSGATQVFGMTQSMERVGVKEYMRAQGRVLRDATSAETAGTFVRGKSLMMDQRHTSQTPEMLELQNAGFFGGYESWMRKHAYWLMHKAQWLVDVPTWLAGYENAKRDFPEATDAKHVALADQAVIDTQGTGFVKDMAKVQRANEFMRTLMQFGSFFNKTYNMGRGAAGNQGVQGIDKAMHIGRAFILLVGLPAVAMSVFKQSVKPSQENDGSVKFWAKELGKANLSYLLSTMVLGRELSSAIEFGYQGPAGMRGFGIVSGLVHEIAQGKADHGLEKALLYGAALVAPLPAAQLQRVIDGLIYDSEHGTVDPRPPLFGPPR